MCASQDALLIDDTQSNVDKFIEYGGQGFVWPHPYKLIEGEISIERTFNNLERKIH